jgi:hypothetical protein
VPCGDLIARGVRHRLRRAGGLLASAVLATALAGCFDVQSPDLFLITRTGQGGTLTLLINDSGTIRCNGGKARPISDSRLIAARDLSDNLVSDATNGLTIPAEAGEVYYFRIKLQPGTVSFPDRAAQNHMVLAQAELFASETASQACGLPG